MADLRTYPGMRIFPRVRGTVYYKLVGNRKAVGK